MLDGVGAPHLAALCRRLIHDVLAGGHLGGGVAAVLLAVLSVRAVTGRRKTTDPAGRCHRDMGRSPSPRMRRLRVGRGSHDRVHRFDCGGAARQVVVSNALVAALSEDELTMVVRHELAHLRGGHHYYLAMAAFSMPYSAGFPWCAPRLGLCGSPWSGRPTKRPSPPIRWLAGFAFGLGGGLGMPPRARHRRFRRSRHGA